MDSTASCAPGPRQYGTADHHIAASRSAALARIAEALDVPPGLLSARDSQSWMTYQAAQERLMREAWNTFSSVADQPEYMLDASEIHAAHGCPDSSACDRSRSEAMIAELRRRADAFAVRMAPQTPGGEH